MKLTEAETLARDLMQQHGVGHVPFIWDNAKRRLGSVQFSRMTGEPRHLSLSRPIAFLSTEAEVRDTILHEIAHALVGHQHHHDYVWQAKCREIGGNGNRTAHTNEDVAMLAPWVAVCPSGHISARHRRPRPGRLQSCGKCSRRFDHRFILTWQSREAYQQQQNEEITMSKRRIDQYSGLTGTTINSTTDQKETTMSKTQNTVSPVQIKCPACGVEQGVQCVSAKGGKTDIHSARRREAEQMTLAGETPLQEAIQAVVDSDKPEAKPAKPSKQTKPAARPAKGDDTKAAKERKGYATVHDLTNVPKGFHRALGLGVRVAPQLSAFAPAWLTDKAHAVNPQDDGSVRYVLTRQQIFDLHKWATNFAASDEAKQAKGVGRSITALVKWTERLLTEALPSA